MGRERPDVKKRCHLPQISIPPDATRQQPCQPEDYNKIEFIGDGSYGMVHKAVQNGKPYAIKTHKCIDSYVGDQIVFRFVNELLMLSSGALLKHQDSKFVIKMRDWFVDGGKINIVMDYCPVDLNTMMNKYFLTRVDIQHYAAQIILGLEEIHAAKIVHNDLKPENILLDSDGNVKITDFGISELCKPNQKKRGLYGTPLYMAPETLNFRGHDQTADYFSLGVILYEMLMGELPYKGQTTADIIQSQRKKLKFKNSIPLDAQNLIRGLLTRSVSKRADVISKIKSHSFFAGLSWEKVQNKEIPSPYNPVTGAWADDFNSYEGSPRKRLSCKRDIFLKLASVFASKKSKRNVHPGSSNGMKSLTDKLVRRNLFGARFLSRSLNRFSVNPTPLSDCDVPKR